MPLHDREDVAPVIPLVVLDSFHGGLRGGIPEGVGMPDISERGRSLGRVGALEQTNQRGMVQSRGDAANSDGGHVLSMAATRPGVSVNPDSEQSIHSRESTR